MVCCRTFIPLLMLLFYSVAANAQTSPTPTDDIFVSEDIFEESFGINTVTKPEFELKTNVIPWAATIPNLEGEVWFHPAWSASLGLWWCPWKVSDRYSLKILSILPEARWWPANDWKGHFLGVHLNCAWFNLRYKDTRYQDAGRPLLGGGITYGYLFRFDYNWGLELSIGLGYMSMRYDRFYNISNGARIDTRLTSYWGIDRLGVSFVYRFD